MPKVSIILSTFNHEKYLSACVDSVLGQTFKDYEFVIVNNGSTDGTSKILDTINDLRVKVVTLEINNGAGFGYATAYDNCCGEYVAFVSSDDIFEPTKIAEQVEILDSRKNCGAVFAYPVFIDEDGHPLNKRHKDDQVFYVENRTREEWLNHFFYFGNCLCFPSAMVRREIYQQIRLNIRFRQISDLDLWIKMALITDFYILKKPLVKFRVRDGLMNESSARPDVIIRQSWEMLKVLKNYENLTPVQFGKVFKQPAPNNVLIALAKIALNINNPVYKIFGLDVWYEGLTIDNNPDYTEFYKATGKPIFGVTTNDAVYKQKIVQAQPWVDICRLSPTEKQWAIETTERDPSVKCGFLIVKKHDADLATLSITSIDKLWVDVVSNVVTLDSSDSSCLNQSVQQIDCDWIALIDAGDELAADASFRLTQAIRKHPEWQVIYTDEDTISIGGEHSNPHCKPDFSLDYLRSMPYMGSLLLIKKSFFISMGGFGAQAYGMEEYDFMLRVWEQVGDAGIGHVPEVLYHRREGSSGRVQLSMEQILHGCEQALVQHLQRLNIKADVLPGPFPPSFRVVYALTHTPLVSIIIPTRNQLPYLQRCLESIIAKTRYTHYEILVVDNDSDDAQTCAYLDLLINNQQAFGNRIRVLRHPGTFNFSAMNNRAVEIAQGEMVLMLNNDTAVLYDDWLEEMVSHALRPGVGVVGAKLQYPDGKIQHAGVILGMKGPAEHAFIGHAGDYRGYFGRAQVTQNYSAVTGACLLISKALYQQLGGLDEQAFKVSLYDIDLCMKVRQAGHSIVWTPWAVLLHEGSASQKGAIEVKSDHDKQKRFLAEKQRFYQRWLPKLAFDPAYNRHLSLCNTDFLLEDQPMLSWDADWRPRPRILAYPYDRQGCGEYRIIAPMRALRQAGMVQGGESMRLFEPAELERFAPESIVLQKPVENTHLDNFKHQFGLINTFRVFEIDDLLTNLPIKSYHKAHIHKDIAKRIRKAAGFCHRLLVTTDSLAQAYAGMTDEVVIQPNYIEHAVWGGLAPARRGGAKPRVGWAGGIGHTGDLEMLADMVRDLANEVDWVFFGLCPETLVPYVREIHGGVPLSEYPAKLASLDLDLAIAPLEDNAFNDAKSNLRLLEYGALGYPVVCSDVTPYQGDIPAWRVANRYREWVKTIREVVVDRHALARAGDELRQHIRDHWLLENHLDAWLKAWLP